MCLWSGVCDPRTRGTSVFWRNVQEALTTTSLACSEKQRFQAIKTGRFQPEFTRRAVIKFPGSGMSMPTSKL